MCESHIQSVYLNFIQKVVSIVTQFVLLDTICVFEIYTKSCVDYHTVCYKKIISMIINDKKVLN